MIVNRAYQIEVRETLTPAVRAGDCVSIALELLEILPSDQMTGLFVDELLRRGFQQQSNGVVRNSNGVGVTIDPARGTVVMQTMDCQNSETEPLEARLADLQVELAQAVNRTTAEALKRKAAQLGRIKEMIEDPLAGSLTIVLEV